MVGRVGLRLEIILPRPDCDGRRDDSLSWDLIGAIAGPVAGGKRGSIPFFARRAICSNIIMLGIEMK